MNVNVVNFEKAVLSSFLFDYILFEETHHLLEPNDFYLPVHKEIFKVMSLLYDKEMPIDEDFIIKYSDRKKISEADVINVLSANPISNANSYIEMIKEHSTKRKLSNLGTKIKAQSIDEDILSEDIKSKIQSYMDNLENKDFDKYDHKSGDLIDKIKQQMEDVNSGKSTEKFHSGLENLDKILDGIEDGELVVIAARPSMGKTSLISSITNESLKKNNGVLIESLEMSADKIMRRLLSTKSGENLSDLKNGLVKKPTSFKEATEFLNTDNLIIHDESYPTLYQLQAKIKKALRKNPNIKNILVDHTGKIKLAGKTREDIEIGYITNSLKKIARDYNIRVFLLQQLNRGVESRENKRPLLSDLKNSGNIEEDADIVLGLYRDSYYKSQDNETYEKDLEEAEIIILKNRDGALGTAKVWFERKTSSFRNKTFIKRDSIIQFK